MATDVSFSLSRFLDLPAANGARVPKQIISLGAGFDTSFFVLSVRAAFCTQMAFDRRN
jgi:hypothetical protein